MVSKSHSLKTSLLLHFLHQYQSFISILYYIVFYILTCSVNNPFLLCFLNFSFTIVSMIIYHKKLLIGLKYFVLPFIQAKSTIIDVIIPFCIIIWARDSLSTWVPLLQITIHNSFINSLLILTDPFVLF